MIQAILIAVGTTFIFIMLLGFKKNKPNYFPKSYLNELKCKPKSAKY
jgi:hypothetical protein